MYSIVVLQYPTFIWGPIENFKIYFFSQKLENMKEFEVAGGKWEENHRAHFARTAHDRSNL